MEAPSYAVPAVFSNNRKIIFFSMALNGVSDIAKASAGFYLSNTSDHGIIRAGDKTVCADSRLPNEKHSTGVAMKPVFNDGNIDVNDVAIFQFFSGRDAMADHVIYRCAD